jgi:hypothetical protein
VDRVHSAVSRARASDYDEDMEVNAYSPDDGDEIPRSMSLPVARE